MVAPLSSAQFADDGPHQGQLPQAIRYSQETAAQSRTPDPLNARNLSSLGRRFMWRNEGVTPWGTGTMGSFLNPQ